MPPVGMMRTPVCRKAPSRDLSILTPPAASAGKNFWNRHPRDRAWLISEAVETPGTKGKPRAEAAFTTRGSKPGATPKEAPAWRACSTCSGVRSVPAPTSMSGTSREMRAMASAAAAVRNVISMQPQPLSIRALARGTAFSASLMTTTGTSLMADSFSNNVFMV